MLTHTMLPAGVAVAAYVQPVPASSAAQAPTQAMLLQWCGERLPAASLPLSVQLLQQLPRGPAGKLSRAALPPPPWAETMHHAHGTVCDAQEFMCLSHGHKPLWHTSSDDCKPCHLGRVAALVALQGMPHVDVSRLLYLEEPAVNAGQSIASITVGRPHSHGAIITGLVSCIC